jgi:hypothetical protein
VPWLAATRGMSQADLSHLHGGGDRRCSRGQRGDYRRSGQCHASVGGRTASAPPPAAACRAVHGPRRSQARSGQPPWQCRPGHKTSTPIAAGRTTNHSRASSGCRSRVTLHSWLPLPSNRSLLCGNLQHGVLVIESSTRSTSVPRVLKEAFELLARERLIHGIASCCSPQAAPVLSAEQRRVVRYSPLSRCTSAS